MKVPATAPDSPRRARLVARFGLLAAVAALAAATLAPAQATAAPAWDVRATWGDTNLPPGGGALDPGSLLRFEHKTEFNNIAGNTYWRRRNFEAKPDRPAGVAVNSAGTVYLVEIDSFVGGGATLRAYDAGGNETGAPCPLEWAPGTPLPQPAVDSAGNIYYPNTATGAVQKLEPDCTEVTLANPIAGLTNPNSVTLDASGNIYVVDGTTNGSDIASGRLRKFGAGGAPLGAFAGLDGSEAAKGEVTAVTVDKSTGDVFVGRGWGESFHVERYDEGGSLLEDFGAGVFATRSPTNYAHDRLLLIYNQLAVDESDKTLYAANRAALGELETFQPKGGEYALAAPLFITGKLAASVAVNQASREAYVASVGALRNLGQFTLQPRSIGTGVPEEALTITDELPAGVTATDIHWEDQTLRADVFVSGSKTGSESRRVDFEQFCTGTGTETVTCVLPETHEEVEGSTVYKSRPVEQIGAYTAEDVAGGGWKMPPPIFIDVEVASGASGAGTNVARVEGGGMPQPFTDEDGVPFSNAPASFGVVPSSFGANSGSFPTDVFDAAYPAGEPSRQAGEHPFEYRVAFELNQYSAVSQSDGTRYTDATGRVRTVEVTLPRGLIGNPEALPKCDPVDFAKPGAGSSGTQCPPETQVGYLNVSLGGANANYGRGGFGSFPNQEAQWVPIYSLEPPRGTPVDLSFNAGGRVIGHIYGALDPAQDYAIKAVVPDISSLAAVSARAGETTIWGVPGDPAHDRFRYFPEKTEGKTVGAPWGSAPIRPFFTNPMDCGVDNGGHRIRVEGYREPGVFSPVQEYPEPLNVEGCDDPRFRFEPDITLQPTSRDAGGPTGLDVHLEVPQRDDRVKDAEDLYATESDGTLKKEGPVQAIATPPMKKAVVTMPAGMTISPSAAQGLGNCSPAQIGLGTNDPVSCPDNSQYGTLTLHTPLLPIDEQPEGFIYIAKQSDNPFHNFLSLYLVIQEPDTGILVKIPGRVDLNPGTGQITTTFDDLPQFPVSDFQLSLKGGVRAGLVNPATCGTKTIRAEFFSWHDPATPKVVTDSYDVTNKPDGSSCVNSLAERPFAPGLEAGTTNNLAGSFSPFAFRLTRTDDDQEFSQLGVSLPPGLIGKLAGVGECSEAGIAQAIGRTGAGEGALEQASPSCPASSLIGTTNVGVGVGVPLTYVPGKVYLAGPYRGAPLSMVVISPTIVGPYDLGVIAVRSALHVDPETTQVSVASDPFPLIYQGIPVRIRDIRVRTDRPEFTLNPTSCAEKQITAHVTGTGGDMNSTADDTAVDLANRFQAADCASLGFRPKLNFRLFGGTRRGAHPKLRAVVRMPQSGANIARAAVSLPRSEFLDQSRIRTVCTRVQFAAEACPKGSIYGHVKAKTPLLDEVLTGPIYLRSSDNLLPDLVAVFRGRVEANLVGRIDSVRGGIRNTFELVPDVPVSWAVFTFQGGNKGLLINSTNLCKGKAARAVARLGAHNGRRRTLRPELRNACGKQRKAKSKR